LIGGNKPDRVTPAIQPVVDQWVALAKRHGGDSNASDDMSTERRGAPGLANSHGVPWTELPYSGPYFFFATFLVAAFFTGFAAALSALRFAAFGSTAALNAAPGTNLGTF